MRLRKWQEKCKLMALTLKDVAKRLQNLESLASGLGLSLDTSFAARIDQLARQFCQAVYQLSKK